MKTNSLDKLPPDNGKHSTSSLFASEDKGWSWEPPSLCPGKKWFKGSLRRLRNVVLEYPADMQDTLILDGQQCLKRHRRNYGPNGPQYLQLLWWEFPVEHRDAIRCGSSMNFLKEPELS